MLAGHVGVALTVARFEPRVNAGTFVGAALLLDVVLWLFILAGWEQVVIPPDFELHHQPLFTFPYSHSLVAAVAWSLLGGAAGAFASRLPAGQRLRAAVLLGGVVFSHWVLDVLVHRPELPLAGAGSTVFGFALWDQHPIGLALEAGCVLVGVVVFSVRSGLPGTRVMAVGLLALTLLVFTVAGMSITMAPPSAREMAGSSLVLLLLVVGTLAWLDVARSQPRAPVVPVA